MRARLRAATFTALIVSTAAAAALTISLVQTRRAQPPARPTAPAFDSLPHADSAASRTVNDTVQSAAVDVWLFRLSGLRGARLRVIGGADARLSCGIFDPAGQAIAIGADEGSCDRAWMPMTTGAYRIEVRNAQSEPVPYRLSLWH